jgi:hypothetical protein
MLLHRVKKTKRRRQRSIAEQKERPTLHNQQQISRAGGHEQKFQQTQYWRASRDKCLLHLIRSFARLRRRN